MKRCAVFFNFLVRSTRGPDLSDKIKARRASIRDVLDPNPRVLMAPQLPSTRMKGFAPTRGYSRQQNCPPMKTFRFLPLFLASLFVATIQAADEILSGTPVAPATLTAATALLENTTCKIHRTTPVRYPVSLMREGIAQGEARVLINIDANGQLTESMVLAYTQKPFADAALAAIGEWRYEAARYGGETVGTVADITFRFEIDGVLLVERVGVPHFQQNDAFGSAYIYKPHGLRTLDGIPTPIQVTQPIYPKEWIDQGLRGSVIVDFYIDETGAVRMTSVASTAQPLLAAAAAAAVREWRFAPPLRKGRPVLAHCQQVFRFEPEAPKP